MIFIGAAILLVIIGSFMSAIDPSVFWLYNGLAIFLFIVGLVTEIVSAWAGWEKHE